MTTDDLELLQAYISRRSEEAFRALVERHAALVQGAARRLVRNEALAQDVTQAVFILLARKADRLPAGIILAGWLYQTTRWVASQALRAERRRLLRHEQLATMQESPEIDPKELPPHIEQAMARLNDDDRNVVLLRYFENQSWVEVARTLGLSEAAAKMRAARALDKLRLSLQRTGVVVSAVSLGAALAAHAAPAVNAGLASTLAATALSPSSAGITTTTLLQSIEIMTWNKIKTLAVAALIVLLLASGTAWHFANKPADPKSDAKLATFTPMAGQWEGTFASGDDPARMAPPIPAALAITTNDNGRRCEIEMRVGSPAQREQLYRFSHAILDGGTRLFSTHDPQLPRTDGEGVIVESIRENSTGEWGAIFHQTFENNRGQMEGSWHRIGDRLVISSHDEYRSPRGTNHVFSELQLRRSANSQKK